MNRHTQHDYHVDVIGLHCPQPVINCKASLAKMANGEVLKFTASDHSSLSEIPRLVEALGDELIAVCKSAGHYRFTIKRNTSARKGYRTPWRFAEITGLAALAQLIRSAAPTGAFET